MSAQALAQYLRQYRRQEMAVSRSEIAKLADISLRTYNRLECAQTGQPQMGTIRAVATAMDLEPGMLVRMLDEEETHDGNL